jgi:hypothetical protein
MVELRASGLQSDVAVVSFDREDSQWYPKHQAARSQCALVAHIAPEYHWRSSLTLTQQLGLFVELCCALMSKKEKADVGALPQSSVFVSVCYGISPGVIELIW